MKGQRGTLLPAICVVALLCLVCAKPALVKPVRLVVADAYEVDPQIAWTRISRLGDDEDEVWTVDGEGLEFLFFSRGLADGDPLFKETSKEELEKLPVYRSYMSESEIMEFVSDSLIRRFAEQLEARNLRPARFVVDQGFRFEFSYLSSDGLAYEGLATGAVLDDRLHVILYAGTALHHYQEYLPHVLRLIDSIGAPGVSQP